MLLEDLLKHFSWEVMVRIKEAGENGEVREDCPTLFHDFNQYVDTIYLGRDVCDWFYAKYDGECDELVVWLWREEDVEW